MSGSFKIQRLFLSSCLKNRKHTWTLYFKNVQKLIKITAEKMSYSYFFFVCSNPPIKIMLKNYSKLSFNKFFCFLNFLLKLNQILKFGPYPQYLIKNGSIKILNLLDIHKLQILIKTLVRHF